MMNDQLKPDYNLQTTTCNQFVLGYDIFQNPINTKTLIPFSENMNIKEREICTIVADVGYSSESNYCYLEDEFGQYATMLKERSNSRKTDELGIL